MDRLPSPYVGFQKDAHNVRGLWERFNCGLAPVDEACPEYHRLLMADWRRCSALGVDVAMSRGRRLSDEEFRQRRDAERLLVATSLPIIQEVSRFLVDVPGILILTDRTGTVLHIGGDAAVQERAATLSGIVEGSQWNEATAGTNGVGTALHVGGPVHVHASEHFCEGWHSWSCAAAPVFDVDGRNLLGIVDFTTVHTDFRHQALGLAVSLANNIQARMALQLEMQRRRVLTAFSELARHYPHDDLLALDHAGRPLVHSPNERCRQLAERWGRPGETGLPAVRERVDVLAPDSGRSIGCVLLLARPQACQQVFRLQDRPPPVRPAAAVAQFGEFVSADPETVRMLADLTRVAVADVNLLLQGETGTGKELLARHVHALSPRRAAPYLAVNCGAISESLMESTFFGYVRGAFSGADPRGRAGYFESAGEGTLFLDEVGELPPAMQAALLRVLEDGSFQRVGSCQTLRARCRIIAATHRDLERLIEEGRFRRDLYFRLRVVRLHVKPLRERAEDIGLLAQRFAEQLRAKHGLCGGDIAPRALAALRRHAWPGNVRELRNAVEAALLCAGGDFDVDCLPPEVADAGAAGGRSDTNSTSLAIELPTDAPVAATGALEAVRQFERKLIVDLLREHRNVRRVAQMMGVARSTLYRKFADLRIDPAAWIRDG